MTPQRELMSEKAAATNYYLTSLMSLRHFHTGSSTPIAIIAIIVYVTDDALDKSNNDYTQGCEGPLV